MKNRIKDYFNYSSSEKKGAIFLSFLIAIAITGYWVIPVFESNSTISFSDFKKDVEAFNQDVPVHKKQKADQGSKNDSLFMFNPNQIGLNEWQLLGFSYKQAESILNYGEKYGFSSKKDVEKLYVVSSEKYKELEPYIDLPTKKNKEKKEFVKTDFTNNKKGSKKTYSLKSNFENIIVEINSADTTTLKTLKGIGSYYAKKIINYKTALGGFRSVEQLKEVYGLKPEVIDQNISRLTVDTILVQKISVNTATAKELKSHPYINWNMANSIVQVRERHGDYDLLEKIKKSDLVNDEIYRRIAPYLKIE